MLNAEKYKKEIEVADYNFGIAKNGEIHSCECTVCGDCIFSKTEGANCIASAIKWLLSECEEPKIKPKIEPEVYDLKCDDKVEVSNDGIHWKKQHLKFAEGNVAVAWSFGKTSFSANTNEDIGVWEYARIPREE